MCLRRGHISRECRSQAKCYKGGGRHHVSICSSDAGRRTDHTPNTGPDPPSSNNPPPAQPEPTPNRSTLNAGAPAFSSQQSNQTINMLASSDRAVLLQTAQALALNPDAPQKSRQVQIVFDCGSQRRASCKGTLTETGRRRK